MEIYLDNSATTAPSHAVRERMWQALESTWGNPSSSHRLGFAAEKLTDAARDSLLAALGITERGEAARARVIFTGSGTEADNLAILGTARAKAQHRGGRIITSDSEHPAVLEPCAALEREGYEVVRIPTRGGVLDMESFSAALNSRTFLVSIMAVNNETGAAYDIARAFRTAHDLSADIITHTDAVQAFSHIPFAPDRLDADMVTVSAHKIHGPKGVGALIVRPEILKAKKLSPIIFGGGQEHALRSGTENVPGIVGFGAAADEAMPEEIKARLKRFSELRSRITEGLPTCVTVNAPIGKTAPHIISLTLPDIKSETMLNYLSERGIYVSSGSACASHGKKASHVLTAFGLTTRQADCTIRVSLDDSISDEAADIFLDALRSGCDTLARMK